MSLYKNTQTSMNKSMKSVISNIKDIPNLYNLKVYWEELKNKNVKTKIEEIILSLEQKITLLTALLAKCNKLESLSLSRNKYSKRLIELQRKGDFDLVSKVSSNLSSVNEELKALELELTVKCDKISQFKCLYTLELEQFKLSQLEVHNQSLLSLGKINENEEKAEFSLADEFLKFEMSLEAAVIEKRKIILSSPLEKDKHAINVLENVNVPIKQQKQKKRQSLAFVPVYNSLVAGFKTKLSTSPVRERENQLKEVQEESKIKEDKVDVSIDSYLAIFDYLPQQTDEIELKESDQLLVSERNDDGWFIGRNLRTGKKGLFPGNYCQKS